MVLTKVARIKVQILVLPNVRIKIHEIPHVISRIKSLSFSSNIASLFSVMKDNSSVFFHLNLYMLWIKESEQSGNFETFDCSHEN